MAEACGCKCASEWGSTTERRIPSSAWERTFPQEEWWDVRPRVSLLPARLAAPSWSALAQSKRQHPECPRFGNLLAETSRVRCVVCRAKRQTCCSKLMKLRKHSPKRPIEGRSVCVCVCVCKYVPTHTGIIIHTTAATTSHGTAPTMGHTALVPTHLR